MHNIRKATDADISGMVAISETKRIEYQGYSPLFWRKAPDSSARQESYFQSLLRRPDLIALIAEADGKLAGFVIGAIATAPPVYNPGGPVCIIDDFVVADSSHWPSIGAALLEAVQHEAKGYGAVLVVVVCAQRDQAKRTLLQEAGLSVASEWHVRPL
ncbi:MAG: GNAT family N-acetyltransferase [Candidatus Tectomicrobia bacterium]|nr:GNAT family N-acetyltransferase [Candidatus Tectomicrobia bacterium]